MPSRQPHTMEAGPRSSLRSRKRLFTVCLLALAVAFTVLILRGRHEQIAVPGWLNAGVAYRPMKQHRLSEAAAATRNETSAVINRGSATGVGQAALEGAPNDATWTDDVPLEGALPLGAEQFAPIEDDSDTEVRLHSSKADIDDVKPASVTRAEVGDSNELGLSPFKSKQINPETKDDAQTEASPQQEAPELVDASQAERTPSRDGTSAARQTTENVLEHRTTTKPVYYDLCRSCCYGYTTIDHDILVPLNRSELEARGCQRRLPDALIFGVKKGGTTTLRNFLSYHPDIAFVQSELKFFTSTTEAGRGLEHYRAEMAYASPGQLAMEKTPAYSHYPKVPALISQALPRAKLIIIMRDPVERAVSDYVHMQVTIAKRCGVVGGGGARGPAGAPPRVTTSHQPADCAYKTRYQIAETFEGSVIDERGEVRAASQLVSKGIYVLDLERYLRFFPREQILALDGEAFIRDPYPAVKAAERFLGVRDYFASDFFYFDAQKGFYCLSRPIPENCMSPAKGRPHPVVRPEVLRKLREFYRPYNDALRKLVGVDFQWSS